MVVEAGMRDDSRSSSVVSKLARIYTYDHACSSKSKAHPGPNPHTAASMVADLSALLSAADIPRPYVVACHSYGGFIAPEFLALKTDEVVGMLFVDTNTERTNKEIHMPMEALGAIAGDVDSYKITGLDCDHKIDPGVWKGMKRDSGASEQEPAGEAASISELTAKNKFEHQVMGTTQLW